MATMRSGAPGRPNDPSERTVSPMAQQIISLLIILHLFCVFLVLTSYTRRSALQNRLLSLMAPYVRTLNLAPASAPYHLTQYDALTGDNSQDDEHFLELEITGADGQPQFHNLNEGSVAFPDARRRYRALASEMVYTLADEATGDNRLAEYSRAAASYALKHYGADAGVIRLKHHLSQPRLLSQLRDGYPEDPHSSNYIVTSYEADVLLDDDGEVQLIKREDRTQVAPPVSKPAANASPAQKGS